MKKIKSAVKKAIAMAKKDKEILAAIIFGSAARGEKFEDIDICLVMEENFDKNAAGKKRINFSLFSDKFDVHIFQQLPLYIRSRILKDGKIIFCRDRDKLYDLAFQTIREFEDFKPIYQSHVEVVLNG